MVVNENKFDNNKFWEFCNKLPFNVEEDEIRRKQQQTAALEIARCISDKKSIGVSSGTGTGKTIIALMAVGGCNFRTLFLVPLNELVKQHYELAQKIFGHKEGLQMFRGGDKKHWNERQWNSLQDRIIFATAHTFVYAYKHGIKKNNIILDLSKIDAVVLDETHHAVEGRHAHRYAADICSIHKIPTIALSASPAETSEEKIKLEKICGITSWVTPQIKTPRRTYNNILVEPTREFDMMDELFEELFKETTAELKMHLQESGNNTEIRDKPSWTILTELEKQIRGMEDTDITKWPAIQGIALCQKLQRAHIYFATSYPTLISYALDTLRKAAYGQNNGKVNKSSRQLYMHPTFQKIIALAKEHWDDHPKSQKFKDLICSHARMRELVLTYVGEISTGCYLHTLLSRAGIRSEFVHGGGDPKNRRQQEKIEQLMRERKLDCVLTTSVWAEGRDIPKIDCTIFYKIPPRGIERRQFSGRTGRGSSPGRVLFLLMQKPHYDLAAYRSSAKRLQTMARTIEGRMIPFHPLKRKDPYTLTLFDL